MICLLGNKSDLGEARKVPIEEAESYASTVGAAHFETSAVSSTGKQRISHRYTPALVYFSSSNPLQIEYSDIYKFTGSIIISTVKVLQNDLVSEINLKGIVFYSKYS